MNIPDYPNYTIDRDGNVVNKKNLRILKQQLDKDGYAITTLYNGGKYRKMKIHRLLGMCYIPKIEGKDLIDHINRDKSDNRIENLRWVNASENSSNRSAYKNSIFKERYISITNFKGYKYYRLTMRPYKFAKCYNVNNYDLNDIIKIRDDIINAKSNGSVEEE